MGGQRAKRLFAGEVSKGGLAQILYGIGEPVYVQY